jgi:hypothetical protein
MYCIQAPAHPGQFYDFELWKAYQDKSLFLGGGITGCPDWQAQMLDLLKDLDIWVYNPRRKDFNVKDSSASAVQVQWEHLCLGESAAKLFWFPCETLCPITLYELGYWANSPNLFVGCHPDYARKWDVEFQLSLVNSSVKVVDTLEALSMQVREWSNGKLNA